VKQPLHPVGKAGFGLGFLPPLLRQTTLKNPLELGLALAGEEANLHFHFGNIPGPISRVRSASASFHLVGLVALSQRSR
jgi:hypothetical protein